MAVIEFGERRAGGARRLALDLRVEEIALYVHGPDGVWREEAVAPLDGDDADAALTALCDRASEILPGKPAPADIWLPAEQILSVEIDDVGLGGAEADARLALEKAIAAGTSVPLSDLVYDLAPSSAGWAACAAERSVVAEAQAYVEQWGFAPLRVTTRFGHPAFATGPSFAKAPRSVSPVAPSTIFAAVGGAALAASVAAFIFFGGEKTETPAAPPPPAAQVAAPETPDEIETAEDAAARPAEPTAPSFASADQEDATPAPELSEPQGPMDIADIGVPATPRVVLAAQSAADLTGPRLTSPPSSSAAPAPQSAFAAIVDASEAIKYRLFVAPPERKAAKREAADPSASTPLTKGGAVRLALARTPAIEPGAPPPGGSALETPAPPAEETAPAAPVAEAEDPAAELETPASRSEEQPPASEPAPLAAEATPPEPADDPAEAAEAPSEEEDALAEAPVAEEDIPGPGSVAAAPSPRGRPDALDMTASDSVARRAPTPPARPKSIKPRPKALAAATATGARTARAPSRGPPDGPGVANAATLKNAMRLEEMNLLGVFGSKGSRRAILRLPSGEIMRVSKGAVIDGWVVSRIDAKSLRITRGGQAETLNIVR